MQNQGQNPQNLQRLRSTPAPVSQEKVLETMQEGGTIIVDYSGLISIIEFLALHDDERMYTVKTVGDFIFKVGL